MSGKMTKAVRTAGRVALAAAAVLALSGLAGAWGAPQEADRMARRMNVLERIFDAVLRDSENVVVSGEATRGLMLDGYGALFTFEGSLGGGGLGYMYLGGDTVDLSRRFFKGDGEWVAPAPPPKAPKAPEGEEEVRVPDSMEDLARDWRAQREENRRKARERLAGLKVELTETLLDYGATLGELADEDWVVVAAFLDGFGLDGGGPEQLVLKVKMNDLRQYSAGRLTIEQAKGRVVIDEQ